MFSVALLHLGFMIHCSPERRDQCHVTHFSSSIKHLANPHRSPSDHSFCNETLASGSIRPCAFLRVHIVICIVIGALLYSMNANVSQFISAQSLYIVSQSLSSCCLYLLSPLFSLHSSGPASPLFSAPSSF